MPLPRTASKQGGDPRRSSALLSPSTVLCLWVCSPGHCVQPRAVVPSTLLPSGGWGAGRVADAEGVLTRGATGCKASWSMPWELSLMGVREHDSDQVCACRRSSQRISPMWAKPLGIH